MADSIQTLSPELTPDVLAKEIANKWTTWNTNRKTWLDEKQEQRQYLFATSTRDTSNKSLPWKNSTVTPKLTQIRDNLHANYMAALFPNDKWFVWQSMDKDSATLQKRQAIEQYMHNKLKASGFELVVSQMVYDYIDYGNVFAGHEYCVEKKKNLLTGEEYTVFAGPRAFRVSPLDIVFDPTASSFERTPIIRRTLRSLGDLKRDVATKPNLGYDMAVIDKCSALRAGMRDHAEVLKSDGLMVDGFGSLEQYMGSGMVELLEFWGDIYNPHTGEYMCDQVITVADRRFILRHQPNRSWTGSRPYKHCGWRLRPDNLWAAGPLDQLVGMQYRIDHLENLKADVFDLIAHPVTKIKGTTVEDFVFGPGIQIHCGDDGDVVFERPDAGALSADTEINVYMSRMEELAGAPRDAMGIRTPGEKTKYEVQVLENGAGRIFQSKVNWFERNILEPLLNSMLEEARQSIEGAEDIRTIDPELGSEVFIKVTREDLMAKGKLYPMGARHFAEQARFIQDITQTLQLVEGLPTVKPHISGKAVAKALEENLGWSQYKIVQQNVAITEQAETQQMMNAAEETVQTAAQMPSELQPTDMEVPLEQPAAKAPPF